MGGWGGGGVLKEGGNKCKGWAPQLQSLGFEVREVTGHGDMVDTNLTMTKLSASVVNWPTPVALRNHDVSWGNCVILPEVHKGICSYLLLH